MLKRTYQGYFGQSVWRHPTGLTLTKCFTPCKVNGAEGVNDFRHPLEWRILSVSVRIHSVRIHTASRPDQPSHREQFDYARLMFAKVLYVLGQADRGGVVSYVPTRKHKNAILISLIPLNHRSSFILRFYWNWYSLYSSQYWTTDVKGIIWNHSLPSIDLHGLSVARRDDSLYFTIQAAGLWFCGATTPTTPAFIWIIGICRPGIPYNAVTGRGGGLKIEHQTRACKRK